MGDFTSGYEYQKGKFEVTDEMKKDFDENGYIIVRKLFSTEEADRVLKFIKDKNFHKEVIQYDSPKETEGKGENIGMIVWNYPGDDLTGWMTRCHRVADTAEKLVGGEIYLYHAKIIVKEPRVGGSMQWHQDYGYWYNNGCMRPNMITVVTALEKVDKENGCLQLLKGSNQMGRIQHVVLGNQVTAEPERLNWVKEECPLVYAEMNAGDTIFFHCNTLHCSARNTSNRTRYVFNSSFNRMDNNPRIKHHHPFANKMEKVDDSLVLEGESPEVDWLKKDFMRPGFVRNEMSKISDGK